MLQSQSYFEKLPLMTERDRRFGEKIRIPEFGEFDVVEAVDDDGCVDPRKAKDPQSNEALPNHSMRSSHSVGALRSPGATFGKAMAVAAAVPGISPQAAIEAVAEWKKSKGKNFTWHEDDHDHQQDDGLGCGHIDRASKAENENLYGLPSRVVRTMRDYVRQKVRGGEMKVEAPKLTGSHREKGVLVVLSEDKTVNPVANGNEFFRHDALRHDEEIKGIGRFLRSQGIPAGDENLLAAAEKQRNATLTLLAEDLPVYEVDLRNGKKEVTYKGRIPKRSK